MYISNAFKIKALTDRGGIYQGKRKLQPRRRMATPQQQEEDSEDDTNPIKVLLPGNENGFSELQRDTPAQQVQQHYIRSINSTVVIRQLPSQGLSFQLWPAATTLVTLLDNHSTSPLSPILDAISNGPTLGSLRILELGSGTGIVGIAAAVTLGAKVMVTDLPHVIPNLQFNVDANVDVLASRGGTVSVAALRWGEDADVEAVGREFDLVLASDVVYYDHLYDPLLKTLRLLMLGEGKKMVFVMAHLKRWKKDSAFFKRAKKVFNVEVVYVDRPSEGSRVGVVVYRFASKAQRLPSSLKSNSW
ncbi:unnamed protein product [Dovyalis caffra]|uniref:Uncharacterized protein n=1 Tax=Dovyalis caffra TaxID=77055 RepID=A0AAV1RVK0_9ROSI|nr:unnamed protein product [Dovyalis caffra]